MFSKYLDKKEKQNILQLKEQSTKKVEEQGRRRDPKPHSLPTLGALAD